jgi:hypothetical protein
MPAKTSPGIEFYGGYQVYSDSGVDLTLLRENLKRSVEERIESNANAVKFARELASASSSDRTSWGKKRVFDAEGLLRELVKHDVDFVVIGGLAMIAHGSAYVTRDLDICYSRTSAVRTGSVAIGRERGIRNQSSHPVPGRLDCFQKGSRTFEGSKPPARAGRIEKASRRQPLKETQCVQGTVRPAVVPV